MAFEREAGGSGIKKQKIGGVLTTKPKDELENTAKSKFGESATIKTGSAIDGNTAPKGTGLKKVEPEKVGGQNDKWDNVIDYTAEKVDQTPETPEYKQPEVTAPEPEVTPTEKPAGNMTGPDWYNEQMGNKVPVTTPEPAQTTSRFDKTPDVDALKQYVTVLTSRLNERKNGEKPADYGVPTASEDENDLKNPWEVLGNSVDSSDALDTWGNVLDNESALGNGYVTPVTTPPMSQEEWLQTPEGQAALANQMAKQANDATLKANAQPMQPMSQEEWLQTTEGQDALARSQNPEYQENAQRERQKALYEIAQRESADERERRQAVIEANRRNAAIDNMVYGGAAQPAANGYPDVTPSVTTPERTKEPTLEEIQQAYVNDETKGPQLETPSLKGAIQNALDNWLLSRNGNTEPQTEVDESGTFSPMQMDYILNQDTGPEMPDSAIPSYGDVLGQIVEDYTKSPEKTGTQADLTFSEWTPTDYSGLGESNNPNVGRNSTAEWRALINGDELLQEGYDEAKKQAGWSEADRRAYAQYYANKKGMANPMFDQRSEYVEATPESKKDRLAKQTEEMIANGTINNMPETNGQTGIEDVLDNIMTGGSQPETDEEKRKRLENVNNYLAENGYTPEAYNNLEKRALLEDMNNYLSENGYTPENYDAYMSQAYTTPSATSSSSGSNIPKGSTTSDPSYGQGGTVVKAPYKEGGYTEQELMDMGNKAWGTTYGYNSYEGYYRASDGHYYPVDQEKAEYYKRYGTYNGWEEPMRDYYNTFGTFYGYTPTWKSTGRNTGGGRSYSYSGGNRSSGYSYNNNYSGGNNSNVQPELTNQTRQRINNIMRNWTF